MEPGCRALDWDLPPRRRSRRSSAETSPSQLPRSSSGPRWRGPGHHLWSPPLRQLHRECRETSWGLAGTKKCKFDDPEGPWRGLLNLRLSCQLSVPLSSVLISMFLLTVVWCGAEWSGVASSEANIYHTLQLSCPLANPSFICFLPTSDLTAAWLPAT